jgi:hypothetical protein
VTFRAGYDEATRLARELPGLAAQDLQGLRQFEVAARVGTGVGSSVAVVTGMTQPLSAPTGNAGRIRTRSAERYGGKPAELEDDLGTDAGHDRGGDTPVGRKRRAS